MIVIVTTTIVIAITTSTNTTIIVTDIIIAIIIIKVVTIIITVRLVADLLSAAGADHVVTMDLHAGQIQVEHFTCFSFCSCEIQIFEGFFL